MKRKNEREDWDNGMTVAPMNGVGRLSSRKNDADGSTNTKKKVGETYTKKEQKAMTQGMFLAMLPRLIAVLGGFALAIAVVVLWLM